MSVDLRSKSLFARISIVLMEDSVVKLERGYTKDRVRRYLFDAIEAVIISQKTPWGRIIVTDLLAGGLGVGILFIGQVFATITALCFIAFAIAMTWWYIHCRTTTIRIVCAHKFDEFSGIYTRRRLRSFRDRLVIGINAAAARRIAQNAPPVNTAPAADAAAPAPPFNRLKGKRSRQGSNL